MTQSRAVAFMREIRDDLRAKFDELIQAGPPLPPKLSQNQVERLVLQGDFVEKADDITFLIARAGSKPAKFLRMHPVYGDLVAGNICTFAELKDHLMRFDQQREGIVVLGLTNAAHQIVAVLARTQAPRRGRPTSKAQESM